MIIQGADLRKNKLKLFGASGNSFIPPALPPITPYTFVLQSRNVLNGSNPTNGSNITSWKDVSGNSDDFNQGAFPPTYATNVLNSLPVVDCTGGGAIQSSSNFVSGAHTWTLMWTGQGGSGDILLMGNDSGANKGIDVAFTGSQFLLSDQFGNSYGSTTSGISGYHIYALQYDGSTLRFIVDGAITISHSVTLNMVAAPIVLGAGTFFEIVGYSSALSTSDLNTDGSWYAGVGAGAPNTGLTWIPLVDSAPWLTASTSGTISTPSADDWVGCKFTFLFQDLIITHLGRIFLTGNSRTDSVGIFDASGNPIVIEGIDCSSGVNDQFNYISASPSPARLPGGDSYILAGLFLNGQDQYRDLATPTVTPDLLLRDARFRSGSGTTGAFSSVNVQQTWIPTNIKYQPQSGVNWEPASLWSAPQFDSGDHYVKAMTGWENSIHFKFYGTELYVFVQNNGSNYEFFVDGVTSFLNTSDDASYSEATIATGLSLEVHDVFIKHNGTSDNTFFAPIRVRTVGGGVVNQALPIRDVLATYGDSITKSTLATDYSTMYSCKTAILKGNCALANVGIGGTTVVDDVLPDAGDSTARINSLLAISPAPKWLVILYGTNDITFGDGGSGNHDPFGVFQDAFLDMITRLSAGLPDTQMLILKLLPRNDPDGVTWLADYQQAQDNAVTALGNPKVTFVNSDFGLVYPADYTDGIHPNALGHTKIANTIAPLLL